MARYGEAFALLGDQPNVVESDPLGFDRIAADLAGVVLASRRSTPFALGIEGDWGTGKSSLMQRLCERLNSEPGVEALWFNAWTASEGDVLEGLIKSVLERMDPSMLRRAARNKRLMSSLRVVTRVGARWLRVGDMVDELWEQMSIDPKARNEMRALVAEAMKQWRAKGAGVPEGRLLCVFVDDLDRCSPGNVFQVFEAIKLYLDAPGLVFVIGYHPAIVTEAILAQKHYGEGATPREYLEKIVQINYPIEAPDDEHARELVAAYVDYSRTAELFEPSIRTLVVERSARNPRRIKRFINNFILRYGLDPGWAEIGAAELVRVQILEMYFPDFARLLGERSRRDIFDEFLQYVDVRALLRQGVERDAAQWARVKDAFAARNLRLDPERTDEELLSHFEEDLSESYPKLASDADFVALVGSLAESSKREQLCDKLARRRRTIEPEVAADSAAEAPYAAGAEVLWIDDNPRNNARLVEVLNRRGVRVTVARDGDEALRLLAARMRPFDLLISDIGRGDRAEAGFEDLGRLRDEGLHTGPAIFYTANITPARRKKAIELEAELTTNPSELLTMAAYALGRQAAVNAVPA